MMPYGITGLERVKGNAYDLYLTGSRFELQQGLQNIPTLRCFMDLLVNPDNAANVPRACSAFICRANSPNTGLG